MLIQEEITHQLSLDSPPNLLALTLGLNIRLRSLTHPNSGAAQRARLLRTNPYSAQTALIFD